MRIQEFVKVLLVESGILGFGIWNTAPINDWNPESKFHWLRILESGIHYVESKIDFFPSHGATLGGFFGCRFLWKAVNALQWELTTWLIPPLPSNVREDWLGWYIQIEQDEKCPPSPTPYTLFFYWKRVLFDETVTVCIFGRGGVDALQMFRDALRSESLRF